MNVLIMLTTILSKFLLAHIVVGHTIQERFLASTFANGIILGHIADSQIDEASGCGASRTHPGILYTLNDHGGENKVYALATNGTLVATYTISGIHNVDWEDISIGPCNNSKPIVYCIYIADTGDSGSANAIYKVEEPTGLPLRDQNLTVLSQLKFSWQEHDCETVMVDPEANVYIISKEKHGGGKIFQLPNSAWGQSQRVHVFSSAYINAPSTHHDPVGGDISPNGQEILVKTHEQMFYWNMHGSQDYMSVLLKSGNNVTYIRELQGESVCWDQQGGGYYTMSEGIHQPIYYYARI